MTYKIITKCAICEQELLEIDLSCFSHDCISVIKHEKPKNIFQKIWMIFKKIPRSDKITLFCMIIVISIDIFLPLHNISLMIFQNIILAFGLISYIFCSAILQKRNDFYIEKIITEQISTQQIEQELYKKHET